MNERIEKLGEQADLLGECTPTKIPGRYVGYITEEQIKKFAELLVRECAKIADDCDELKCEWIGGNILTYFGVKE
jgi:hypothetical protein